MKTTRTTNLLAAALVCALTMTTTFARAADPLPSWNDDRGEAIYRGIRGEGHQGRLA